MLKISRQLKKVIIDDMVLAFITMSLFTFSIAYTDRLFMSPHRYAVYISNTYIHTYTQCHMYTNIYQRLKTGDIRLR